MIKKLMEQYEDLRDQLIVKKADGNLSKLVNMRTEFDNTFDSFFDRKELRVKYEIDYQSAWNDEMDEMNTDITNNDLLENLTEEDKEEFVIFVENEIYDLMQELNEE